MIKKILLITTLLASCQLMANTTGQSKQGYIDQITAKIHSEWRLMKAKDGWGCKVHIIQDKQGVILQSSIGDCNTTDKRFIKQLQKAIDKSSPLPRAPTGLFDSELTLHFKVKGDIDVLKSLRDKANNYKYKAAFNKWLPLAKNNHMPSQYNLGFMYSSGKGVTKDLGKSFYWYDRAAKQGHSASQFGIAWMYQNGVGVEKDINKAVGWYEKAAEQGDKAASFTLGAMAYNGSNGVKEDKARAKDLIQQSADQDYSKAIKFLDKHKF